MYRRLWRLLRPFHRIFGKLIVLTLFYEGGQIILSYNISLMVRLYEQKINLQSWLLVGLGVLIYNELFMRLDNAFDWHIIAKQSHPIYKFLKLEAVKKFMRLSSAWHKSHNSGGEVGQVSDGVWKTLSIIDTMSWDFFPTFIQTVLSIVPLLILSPITALIAVIAFSLFAYLTLEGEKQKKVLRAERHDLYEKEWGDAVESVQSHDTVVDYGQEDFLVRQQTELHDQIIVKGLLEHHLGIYRYNRQRIRVNTTARLIIYAIWVSQLTSGNIDVANLIFVSVLTERLFGSFWRFARLVDQVYNNSEGVKRLLELMDEKEPIYLGTQKNTDINHQGVQLIDVHFTYENENGVASHAIKGINLEIPAGKITAIVGPSGAGKTTIPRIITRQQEIDSGQILIGGIDILDWDIVELRKLFSIVPQGDEVKIFDTDFYRNIAFGKPEASMEEVVRASQLADLESIVIKSGGYQTRVGEHGTKLSGGQKQRLALARAILVDRPIFIFDEATSAVDSITEENIQRNLNEVLQGKTSIIIAHRLSTIRHADKIIVMNEGHIVEQGTHEELMKLNGLYAEMIQIQNKT